ncbi:hypothetical protein ACJX0J_022903, partial [Zea mays]
MIYVEFYLEVGFSFHNFFSYRYILLFKHMPMWLDNLLITLKWELLVTNGTNTTFIVHILF